MQNTMLEIGSLFRVLWVERLKVFFVTFLFLCGSFWHLSYYQITYRTEVRIYSNFAFGHEEFLENNLMATPTFSKILAFKNKYFSPKDVDKGPHGVFLVMKNNDVAESVKISRDTINSLKKEFKNSLESQLNSLDIAFVGALPTEFDTFRLKAFLVWSSQSLEADREMISATVSKPMRVSLSKLAIVFIYMCVGFFVGSCLVFLLRLVKGLPS